MLSLRSGQISASGPETLTSPNPRPRSIKGERRSRGWPIASIVVMTGLQPEGPAVNSLLTSSPVTWCHTHHMPSQHHSWWSPQPRQPRHPGARSCDQSDSGLWLGFPLVFLRVGEPPGREAVQCPEPGAAGDRDQQWGVRRGGGQAEAGGQQHPVWADHWGGRDSGPRTVDLCPHWQQHGHREAPPGARDHAAGRDPGVTARPGLCSFLIRPLISDSCSVTAGLLLTKFLNESFKTKCEGCQWENDAKYNPVKGWYTFRSQKCFYYAFLALHPPHNRQGLPRHGGEWPQAQGGLHRASDGCLQAASDPGEADQSQGAPAPGPEQNTLPKREWKGMRKCGNCSGFKNLFFEYYPENMPTLIVSKFNLFSTMSFSASLAVSIMKSL